MTTAGRTLRLAGSVTRTEACQKIGWQKHAYCLVRNHFPWVIETRQTSLPAGMEGRRGKDLRAESCP